QPFTVIQAGASVTCSVMSIALPQTVNGSLTTSDCISPLYPTSHLYVDRYTFTAVAGQQLAILQSSAAFDTYLILIGPNGVVLTENDDGGGGSNSRIPATSGFRS